MNAFMGGYGKASFQLKLPKNIFLSMTQQEPPPCLIPGTQYQIQIRKVRNTLPILSLTPFENLVLMFRWD